MGTRKLIAIVATAAACAVTAVGPQAAQATPSEEQVIGVVNQSNMGAGAFKKIFTALSTQIERDYNFSPWVKLGLAPKARLVLNEVPSGAWTMTLQENGSGGGEFGLGWHEQTAEGAIVGFVDYAEAGRPLASETMSHEILEMLVDPTGESLTTNEAGVTYREEIADPMYGSYYEIGGQKVADFALPAWFGIADGLDFAWYTFKFTVEAPFTLGPKGYIEMQCPGKGWTTLHAGDANPCA
jgi:hypothetical protein